MTREKALIMALKIVDTCKTYGNEERCNQCPFNISGCILGSDSIPAEWEIAEIVTMIGMERRKDK